MNTPEPPLPKGQKPGSAESSDQAEENGSTAATKHDEQPSDRPKRNLDTAGLGDRITATFKIQVPTHTQQSSELSNIEKMMNLQGIEFPAQPLPPDFQIVSEKEQWDKYTTLGTLAEEGHRCLLLARDENIHRLVVMKVLRFSLGLEKYHMQRFLEEAQILAQLEHPAIVPVYEIGIDTEGQLYFTMRYLSGMTIQNFFDPKNCPNKKKAYLELLLCFTQICRAIAYMHNHGVCHRNLTPHNILVTPEGLPYVLGWSACRIKDKGIAIFDNEANQNIRNTGKLQTLDGRQLGDVNFMAPEVIQEKLRYVDERADVYALGAILYSLVIGKAPFSASTIHETVQKICTKEHSIVMAKARFPITNGVERLVAKAMAYNRTERYRSVDEMLNDVETIIGRRKWFGLL